MLDDGVWTTIWDEEQQVPYKYSQNQWIGYDNPRSVAMKVRTEFASSSHEIMFTIYSNF